MIVSHVNEWIELMLRWSHFVVGIAWIGASFYFNWLENRLHRDADANSPFEGDLWAVHGGGFYHVTKFRVTPDRLPAALHWFKWEAYATWLTGFALLVLIYYVGAEVYLVDNSIAELSATVASLIGFASIALSWIVYDFACRSPLRKILCAVPIITAAYFSLLAFVLCHLFSGRGAFIHVGAAIGTIMVLNVLAIIIPSQRSLVEAMESGRQPDAAKGANALQRSRHNNYFTLPALFMMIAGHAPMTYGSEWNWLILMAISAVGVIVRHFFNVRHLPGKRWWMLAAAMGLLAVLVIATQPRQSRMLPETAVDFASVRHVVLRRCTTCHAKSPVQAGFAAPPAGLILETDEQIQDNAEKIYSAAVITRTMPIGNLSGMTEQERGLIAQWFLQASSAESGQ